MTDAPIMDLGITLFFALWLSKALSLQFCQTLPNAFVLDRLMIWSMSQAASYNHHSLCGAMGSLEQSVLLKRIAIAESVTGLAHRFLGIVESFMAYHVSLSCGANEVANVLSTCWNLHRCLSFDREDDRKSYVVCDTLVKGARLFSGSGLYMSPAETCEMDLH